MSKTGTRLALVAALMVFAVALFRFLGKVERDAVIAANAKSDAQYQEFLNNQQKAYSEQFAITKAAAERASAINEMAAKATERLDKNQERYEALLARWERQADRLDKVLDALERRVK